MQKEVRPLDQRRMLLEKGSNSVHYGTPGENEGRDLVVLPFGCSPSVGFERRIL